MRPNRVYLLHPGPKSHPAIADWVAEVVQFLREEPSWEEWDVHAIPYNERNGFDVQPLFARVLRNPGPVLLLETVQKKPLGDLRGKLYARAIVLLKSPANTNDLLDSVLEARSRHESGEPLLARKLVVAILIVRKLRNLHRWSGNAKGYLWSYDLAKGRGVDEQFADVALEVANDLFLNDILVKKTSQGKPKYALNPDRKEDVHAIADDGTFRDRRLREILLRDRQEISASYLYETQTAEGFTIISEDNKSHDCVAVSEAIAHVEQCPDGLSYKVRVRFRNNRILSDDFEEKCVLLQFLKAFL
jgi:hypothetical protein